MVEFERRSDKFQYIFPVNQLDLSKKRLDVVDALRGFALMAIVVLHSMEQYNICLPPAGQPEWLNSLDKGVGHFIFLLMAGKAYATFSLLFGFSFFIQLSNERERGGDFRLRFAWRMLLLFLFSQIHALFYNGDILLLYSVVGLLLIPVCQLKDRAVFWIALFCLLLPWEWARVICAAFDGSYNPTSNEFLIFRKLAEPAMQGGSFIDLLVSNITNGQLYNNYWQVEHGRIFQSAGLFMMGMLLGRRKYFIEGNDSRRMWKKLILWCAVAFLPVWFLPDILSFSGVDGDFLIRTEDPLTTIFTMWGNLLMMGVMVGVFVLVWFRTNGLSIQRFIIPFGRMSLSNYMIQSVIGVFLFYGYGLALYKFCGMTTSMLIGLGIVFLLLLASRRWLASYRQGPLEYLWKKGTWLFNKK